MQKILSALLAVCIAFSCVFPTFAEEKESCDCGKLPIVVVSGMGAMPFYMNAGTENETVCFPPQVDVGKIVWKAVGGLFRAMFTCSFNTFAVTISDIALDILGCMACDADGLSLYAVTPGAKELAMSQYDPALYADAAEAEFAIVNVAVESVGADHAYYYNYDWRLDPLKNADALDRFIDRVCLETGHEKVKLAACSMGGVQTMAYLEKYGHEKIETVLFLSAAYCGLLFVTNLFTGELVIDQKAFFSWLQTMETGSAFADRLLQKVLGFCGSTILLRPLFRLTNRLGDRLNAVAMDRVMKKVFAAMPGMWAFVRDDRYEEAKTALLADAKPSFVAALDTYHYDVQCRREEILRGLQADGVKIYVLSHYNNGCVPITSSALAHGDNLIETVCTSGGATVSAYGSALPEAYTQQACKAHDHLSADGIIDASTCMFPDSTWFVKNMDHVGCKKGSDYAKLLAWLFAAESQRTVFDDPLYPQFMQTDPKTQMHLEPIR